MITVIRRKLIQSKAYKLIVWAVVVVCAASIGGPGLFQKSVAGGSSIATVNGIELPYNDFARKVIDQENRLHMIRKQYGQYADILMQAMGISSDPQELARQALIRDELVNQAARAVGLYIHPAVMQERLADAEFVYEELSDLVPPYLINPAYGIDMRGLRGHLQRFGYSMGDFEDKVGQALQRLTMRDLVAASSYVPTFELHEQVVRDHARKKFSVLVFSLDDFIRKEQEKGVTQDELQAFYDAHAQNYRVPEKRSALVWKFDPANFGVVVTDEAIKAYYDENKTKEFVDKPAMIQVRRILLKTASEQELNTVYEQAKKLQQELFKDPALFAQKAQELSADKESARQGGLMPAFARGTQDKAFERAAFLLKQDGDISQVIQTANGFEIVQRVHKTQPAYKSLSAVSNTIRSSLMQQQFSAQFAQRVRALEGDEQGWQKFVADKQAKVTQYGLATQDTTKLMETLFSMKEGERQSFVEKGVGVAVRMTGVQKSAVPALATIKGQVEKDLVQDRAAHTMGQRMDEVRTKAGLVSLAQLSKDYGVTLEHTPFVTKDDTATVASLKGKKLPIEAMLTMEKVGLVMVQGNDARGYIVRLDEIAPLEATALEVKKAALAASLEQENGRIVPASFVASLYRNATIKHNDSLPNTQKEYSI